MTIDERLDLFAELLQCGSSAYVWQYDGQGQLLRSNCPDEAVLGAMFQFFGCKEKMFLCADTAAGPIILGSPIGESWIADFIRENGVLQRAIVVGPSLSDSISLTHMEEIVADFQKGSAMTLSLAVQRELVRALERTHYMTPTIMNQIALYLHNILTGEKLGISSIGFADAAAARPGSRKASPKDRNKVWLTEQGLMRMVREGDLNYMQAMDNSNSVSDGVGISSGSGLRKAKYSVIVFISLCVRAAIEGGLSPEVAYSLGDAYIQAVDDAATTQEVGAVSQIMYPDFIQRVHNCRVNPNYSKPIRIACDYIEQNAEGDLRIEAIAARVGYSEYYLSRKFKEEVRTSINDYIKIVKVERAKFLLGCTADSIQEIADRLHFCSRSYFGETFRKFVGCSPVEYRQNYKKG